MAKHVESRYHDDEEFVRKCLVEGFLHFGSKTELCNIYRDIS